MTLRPGVEGSSGRVARSSRGEQVIACARQLITCTRQLIVHAHAHAPIHGRNYRHRLQTPADIRRMTDRIPLSRSPLFHLPERFPIHVHPHIAGGWDTYGRSQAHLRVGAWLALWLGRKDMAHPLHLQRRRIPIRIPIRRVTWSADHCCAGASHRGAF